MFKTRKLRKYRLVFVYIIAFSIFLFVVFLSHYFGLSLHHILQNFMMLNPIMRIPLFILFGVLVTLILRLQQSKVLKIEDPDEQIKTILSIKNAAPEKQKVFDVITIVELTSC